MNRCGNLNARTAAGRSQLEFDSILDPDFRRDDSASFGFLEYLNAMAAASGSQLEFDSILDPDFRRDDSASLVFLEYLNSYP